MNTPKQDPDRLQIPMQRLIDAISDSARITRQDYHLTLGGLIERLQLVTTAGHDAGKIVQTDAGVPVSAVLQSYRGYYSDCAIAPAANDEPWATAGTLLAAAKAVLDQPLEGYKGGQYIMDADTPLWVSEYGHASGLAVIWMIVRPEAVTLITKQVK